jgi:hypothetical protein
MNPRYQCIDGVQSIAKLFVAQEYFGIACHLVMQKETATASPHFLVSPVTSSCRKRLPLLAHTFWYHMSPLHAERDRQSPLYFKTHCSKTTVDVHPQSTHTGQAQGLPDTGFHTSSLFARGCTFSEGGHYTAYSS